VRISNVDMDICCNIINGYAMLERSWKDGDTIEIYLDMPVELMEANPLVKEDAGKIVMQRGPLVYCLEEVDNGHNLSAIAIVEAAGLSEEYDEELLGGITVVKGEAVRRKNESWKESLYRTYKKEVETVKFKAVPYALWGNRKAGEMQVWTRVL
jgi:uncharacterized protein